MDVVFKILDDPAFQPIQQIDNLERWLNEHKPSLLGPDNSLNICLETEDNSEELEDAARIEWNNERNKTLKTIHHIASKYQIKGGKWLFWPQHKVDKEWYVVARAFIRRELGPIIKLKIRCFPPSYGKAKSYCISFFTPDYLDADQREESGEIIRSVGPQGDLFYKPDIFSVLKIYSQNKWGFKVTTDTYRAEDRRVYESRYHMKRRARGYENESHSCDDSENDEEGGCHCGCEEPKVKKKRMKKAEEWVAEAREANTAEWISFELKDTDKVPIIQQREMLSEWLEDNRPAEVGSWDGIGWIVLWKTISPFMILDFKDPKAEWDSLNKSKKNMKSINDIAAKYRVKEGKWILHVPNMDCDEAWQMLANAMLNGELGPVTHMRVSPAKQDNDNEFEDHVICIFTPDYNDTDEVTRVERCIRRAGVSRELRYKPAIFSVLGIYSNNKWGIKASIYSSSSGSRSGVTLTDSGKTV